MVVNGERQLIFLFRLNCALNYTYDFVNLKDNSESQKRRSLSFNKRVTFSFM